MTPYYADDWMTVYEGDCREVMATMPPASVHCVVTSPPYWGLRDYGTATWEGGDKTCDHLAPPLGGHEASGLANYPNGLNPDTIADKIDQRRQQYRATCRKCGAHRIDSQLGLEPTPEEFVANMVAVFREVRRVLRDDGTVWLNLGDSYANTGKSGGGEQGRRAENGAGAPTAGRAGEWKNFRPAPDGLKPKDLVGIPWRVAFALQADGWYLRSDIVWNKPNPMPESVTDRPTKSHEYLFLLSKSPRYFYDADAVREGLFDVQGDAPGNGVPSPREPSGRSVFAMSSMFDSSHDGVVGGEPGAPQGESAALAGLATGQGDEGEARPLGREPHEGERGGGLPALQQPQARSAHMAGTPRNDGERWREVDGGVAARGSGRNLRSVWTIATEPYPGAHFATFPRKLVEPCVKAGTSEKGVCPECGAPWVRVVERERGPMPKERGGKNYGANAQGTSPTSALRKVGGEDWYEYAGESRTTGWRPSCAHDAIPVPATVLDPFAGSGTTLLVAQSLGRRAIGIDLNPEYLEQALKRNAQPPLGLDVA